MNPTNLFTLLGRYIKAVDEIDALHATLNTREDNIASVHSSTGTLLTINNLAQSFSSCRSNLTNAQTTLIRQATTVLTDYEFVVANLPLPQGAGLRSILEALYNDMVVNGYYVSPTNPTATPSDPAPTDNGEVQAFLTIDGYNSPTNGSSSFISWASAETQLVPFTDTLIIECTDDSYSGRTNLDSERFNVYSLNSNRPYSGLTEGSGTSTTINALGAANMLDADASQFTTWESDAPTSWTVDSGTGATDFDETTTAADIFRGTSALQIQSGAAGQVTLSTTISKSNFTPLRSYILGFYAKSSSSTESVTLKLKDGATTLGTVTLDLSADTADYTQTFNALITIPETITSDDLTIELDTSPAATNYDAAINIDGIYLVPAQYVAGVALLIVPHLTPFIKGDRFQLVLTNDLESSNGRFQRFFRNAFNFQLPISGSTLLADTLITS